MHLKRKYFGRWPLVKNIKKRLNFWLLRRLSVHVFDKVALAWTVHERITLVILVSYKHNVATKHGSSKPLATNELWLLELRIKSTSILASIPDALKDMCKSSIASFLVQVLYLYPVSILWKIVNMVHRGWTWEWDKWGIQLKLEDLGCVCRSLGSVLHGIIL